MQEAKSEQKVPVTGMAGYDLMDSGEYRPIILCDQPIAIVEYPQNHYLLVFVL